MKAEASRERAGVGRHPRWYRTQWKQRPLEEKHVSLFAKTQDVNQDLSLYVTQSLLRHKGSQHMNNSADSYYRF